jgi:AcrR family transcriptional regulator
VIRSSGFTKGAFYFHFESKDALALDTFRYKQQQLISRLLGDTADQPDAMAQLDAVLRRRAGLLEEDPSLNCVLCLGAELGATAGPDSEYAGYLNDAIRLLAELVVRGQSEEVFREDLAPRTIAETIFASIIGLDQLASTLSSDGDIGQRTEQLIALLHGGLESRRP